MLANPQLILFGLYELIVVVLCGVLALSWVFNVSAKMCKISVADAVKQGNVAVCIFLGTLALCILQLTTESVDPSVDALRTMVQARDHVSTSMLGIAVGYSIGLFLLSVVVALALVHGTLYITMLVTKKIDETGEIRNGNVAAAIFLSFILVSSTLIYKPAVRSVLGALVPYEMLNKFAEENAPPAGATIKPPTATDGNAPLTEDAR
jgi:uncharacterized membrane protein YjfL (UPF0719 family)